MTEQTMPADKVREILEEWERTKEYADWDDIDNLVKSIRELIPAPERPTLADMPVEERRACAWMQADVEGQDGEWLIIDPFDDEEHAHVIGRRGNNRIFPARLITPRPDLSRMEWTGNEKPSLALPDGWRVADHEDYGRVIVTNPTPDRFGTVCFAFPRVDYLNGFDFKFCDPDELTYLNTGQGADTSDAVPESTLAVGSKWDDEDALTTACRESGRDQIVVADKDGEVFVWSAVSAWWETAAPERGHAPFTIIHAGKKADQ